MKILLLGANGQVGWELKRSLAPLGDLMAYDRAKADLADFGALESLVRHLAPDIIVNAAAYTRVDEAENDEDTAHRINAGAPGVLANTAKDINALLVQYSTDYVFDGLNSEPYDETDTINPIGAYGWSKADGEAAVLQSGCRHLILRTCWVYSLRGRNFPRTILKLAKERRELKVVTDQLGAPTSAELIADATALILHRLAWDLSLKFFCDDVYRLTASGTASWHAFARHLVAGALARGKELSLRPEQILGIMTADYRAAAKRPMNSVLNTGKIRDDFDLELPLWQIHANRFLDELDFGRLS